MSGSGNSSVAALLLGAFSIAALHALIPSHWLAFALVGRAQKWTTRRTLTITALAGTGHVLLTVALGLLLALAGKGLLRAIPPAVEHAAAAGLLIVLGVYFVWSGQRHEGCHHHGHKHDAEAAPLNAASQVGAAIGTPSANEAGANRHGIAGRLGEGRTIMSALVLGMTLSPCLDLLTIYVAGVGVSWTVLAAISAIMAATTVGMMTLLVWLTLRGLERVRLTWLERNEGAVVGGALIALGVLLFFL